MIGYSLKGNPRGGVADMIRLANRQFAPILSLDVPSGLESTSGEPFQHTIKAAATLTLALPKTGLNVKIAKPFVGELYLADISVPPQLYQQILNVEVAPLFSRGGLLRLR